MHSWENNIRMNLEDLGSKHRDSINAALANEK